MPFAPQMGGAGLDDEVSPGPVSSRVVFIEIPDPDPVKEFSVAGQIKAAEKSAAEPSTIKVRVNSPYRVLHEHVAYIAGETLEVPNDSEHQLWVKSGWVEPVVTKGSK
jgi:hypothetical protein